MTVATAWTATSLAGVAATMAGAGEAADLALSGWAARSFEVEGAPSAEVSVAASGEAASGVACLPESTLASDATAARAISGAPACALEADEICADELASEPALGGVISLGTAAAGRGADVPDAGIRVAATLTPASAFTIGGADAPAAGCEGLESELGSEIGAWPAATFGTAGACRTTTMPAAAAFASGDVGVGAG